MHRSPVYYKSSFIAIEIYICMTSMVMLSRKGNNFRGRGFRQNDSGRRDNSSSGQNNNSNRDRNFNNRSQSGNKNGNRKPFGNRGQSNGNFGVNQRGRGRGRGRFDTSPNVRRPRVASKTVNKDKGRCFYCNEFGHFIKECSKKTEDERSRRYSRMDTNYHQEGQYSDYDDTGLYTDDYDDEVFATLNRGVGRKQHPNSF